MDMIYMNILKKYVVKRVYNARSCDVARPAACAGKHVTRKRARTPKRAKKAIVVLRLAVGGSCGRLGAEFA